MRLSNLEQSWTIPYLTPVQHFELKKKTLQNNLPDLLKAQQNLWWYAEERHVMKTGKNLGESLLISRGKKRLLTGRLFWNGSKWTSVPAEGQTEGRRCWGFFFHSQQMFFLTQKGKKKKILKPTLEMSLETLERLYQICRYLFIYSKLILKDS